MREAAARMVQSGMAETAEGRWLTFCPSLRCRLQWFLGRCQLRYSTDSSCTRRWQECLINTEYGGRRQQRRGGGSKVTTNSNQQS